MFYACTFNRPLKERVIKTNIEIRDTKDNTKLKDIVGLWDTGATMSSINIKLLDDLNLVPIGKTESSTANGNCEVYCYCINVVLPNKVMIPNLIVSAMNLGKIDMLIGMDVISKGQFTISKQGEKLTASFVMPTIENTDYVKKIDGMNRQYFKGIGRNALCPCGSGKKVKNCCGSKYL